MKKILVAISAWIGVLGQTAVAKGGRENTQVQKDTVVESRADVRQSAKEIARDKSALNVLAEAGVLKKDDNDKDTSCGSCYKPEK